MSQQPERNREDSFREARKQIVRSAFLALAALGVIVFACYAWFVSSGTVTGTISSVLLNGSTFELASVGSSGAHDDEIRELNRAGATGAVTAGDNWKNASDQVIGTITGSKHDILWNLSGTSNMNNQAGENGDTGIQPGSNGSLQFYVVPKCSGNLKLKCRIDLIPIKKSIDGVLSEILVGAENTEGWYINWFLRGHVLFAYTYEYADSYDDTYKEKNPDALALVNYEDGSFTLELAEVQENKPILVTLRWIWPRLLKNIILEPLFGQAALSNEVKAWMQNNPNHFFYNFVDEVGNPDFSTPENSQKYNNYYNFADDYIGSKVYGVIVQLTTEEV